MDRQMDVSLSRPSPLRLWGFLGVTIGAALVGLGSVSNWAVVVLKGDKSHVLDSPIRGTDVWEGKVTLALALIVLVGIMAVRLASSDRARRAIAYLIVVCGVVGAGIGVFDAVRFTDRFSGGNETLTAIARHASETLGAPASQILQGLLANRAKLISVSHGTGLWMVIAGGVLAAIGGVLSLSWANDGAPDKALQIST